jgi:DNA repair protein RadD
MSSRDYQEHVVGVLPGELEKHRRVVAVGPTGCGKTVVAAMLIEFMADKRVLFVAHRRELINQAHATFARHGITAGVIMADDDRVNPDARVQVASVQTLSARGVKAGYDLIVIDEAHRALANGYQDIAKVMPGAMVLGLTATPCRTDGRGLGEFFDSMVAIAKPSDLYAAGHLAKPVTYVAPKEVADEVERATRGVRTRSGDYEPGGLGRAMNTRKLIGKIVEERQRLAPGVPTVLYAASVKHSRDIAAEFRAAGAKAAHLDGNTPTDERDGILQGLSDGSIEVVCNYDVLVEGWDLRSLGCVILARPTQSVSRYLQMVGRVQRPWEGKAPIVLDHAGNALRHGDPTKDRPWSLKYGDAVRTQEGEQQEREAKEHRAREVEEVEARLVELGSQRAEAQVRAEAMAAKKGLSVEWVEQAVKAMMP